MRPRVRPTSRCGHACVDESSRSSIRRVVGRDARLREWRAPTTTGRRVLSPASSACSPPRARVSARTTSRHCHSAHSHARMACTPRAIALLTAPDRCLAATAQNGPLRRPPHCVDAGSVNGGPPQVLSRGAEPRASAGPWCSSRSTNNKRGASPRMPSPVELTTWRALQ